ncbi:hypothetical protein [Spirillospora sp. CA-128828]|uniref:hypothetical protein n=1 Tax=Spirillospora sp. CA-128828 TaxID=3240033 RepID=UPI003D94AB37
MPRDHDDDDRRPWWEFWILGICVVVTIITLTVWAVKGEDVPAATPEPHSSPCKSVEPR